MLNKGRLNEKERRRKDGGREGRAVIHKEKGRKFQFSARGNFFLEAAAAAAVPAATAAAPPVLNSDRNKEEETRKTISRMNIFVVVVKSSLALYSFFLAFLRCFGRGIRMQGV